MELERVLTKLRFDESVSGYALFTNDGNPFLSFSLPDEILPTIKETLGIHAESLKLMNIMSGAGTVVLARVDSSWVLGVLFKPEESLGMALQKTRSVMELLGEVDLPSPPSPVTEAEPETSLEEAEETIQVEATTVEEAPSVDSFDEHPLPDEVEMRHGCIIHRDENYSQSMTTNTPINAELIAKFGNTALDILMMVDERRTAFKIAEAVARQVEKVMDTLRWCVSRKIVSAECPEEQALEKKELVEVPIFEGELSKIKKEHRNVVEKCDGTHTLQEIAQMLGIPYFQALQSVVPYRGKTVKFVRKSRI
ncbi:hypothetical protein EU537_10395 [Candidatus Thorarchaeota archaeon]|nr:MAG: hypothetical protein EU537_10395 [Candidatus Thorarchaeota archaeon]